MPAFIRGILAAAASGPERLSAMVCNRDDEDHVSVNAVDDVVLETEDLFAASATCSRRSLGIHQEVIACTIERIQKAPPIAGSPLLDLIRDFEELDLSEWMKLCAHFLRPHALLRSPRRLVSLLLCR